jgi:hypothetical protein
VSEFSLNVIMSRWTTNFQNPQALDRVKSLLDVLQGEKLKSALIPPAAKEEVDRAIKVLTLIEVRLSTLDPELFHLNSWGNFTGWLNQAKDQAAAFIGNQNLGHLQNLNGNLDEILNVLKPINGQFSDKEIAALTDVSERFNQKFIGVLEEVRKKADEIQKQFDALSAEVAQGKVRLDKNDQVIESQKTRLDTSIAEFQQQFSTAQESRNLEFQKLLTGLKTTADDQSKAIEENVKAEFESRKSEWSSFLAGSKKVNDEHLDFLNKRKKEVDEIFGAIGQAALAGNFNEIANKEKAAADGWRKIAFGFMVAMGGVAIAAFISTFSKSPDWETFLFRIGTALIIAVPAFYAANESSMHRNREKLIRKNFLELSAIDAYLVHLPEQERNKIKGQLSEKFFGVPEVHEKTESVSKKDLFSLLEKIVKDFTTKGH